MLLAGDAAGVVAPSSGEGIYYAMVGGKFAGEAALACLASGRAARPEAGAQAVHGASTRWCSACSRAMQDAYYKSDDRRERFVSLCHDVDVQRLTFEAYMNKRLVRARPLAHLRIMAQEHRPSDRDRPPRKLVTQLIPAWIDEVLAPVEKLAVHRTGLRHKAVSVFVIDGGRVLIQRRAAGKYHTPGLWANTCCTHPTGARRTRPAPGAGWARNSASAAWRCATAASSTAPRSGGA